MTVIRVIDFETTGMEPPAEVVEYGFCDLTKGADGEWTVGQPGSVLHGVSAIPPETRAVHHISMAEVAGQPGFDAIAALQAAGHCAVIAAHNMAFEEQWLQVEGMAPKLCTLKSASVSGLTPPAIPTASCATGWKIRVSCPSTTRRPCRRTGPGLTPMSPPTS